MVSYFRKYVVTRSTEYTVIGPRLENFGILRVEYYMHCFLNSLTLIGIIQYNVLLLYMGNPLI